MFRELGSASLFPRTSVDQISFVDPKVLPSRLLHGPPRPASALAQPSLPRPLSNILEVSNAGEEDAPRNRAPSTKPGDDMSDVAQAMLPLNRSGATSTMSLPLSSLPERTSSRARLRRKSSQLSRSSLDIPQLPPPPPRGLGHTIPVRGISLSPVRSAAARLNPISSEEQNIPSRTFVRPVRPLDILDVPEVSHPRVCIDLRTTAPLFMGGGTLEGQLYLQIDGGKSTGRRKQRPVLSIGRMAVDVLGVEALRNKQNIFRSLAVELIDESHQPPRTMIIDPRTPSNGFWDVMPSFTMLPFRLDLPINMGPPPYKSKDAKIRYILCATVLVRISGKVHYVRRSQEIAILTVHDRTLSLCSLTCRDKLTMLS